MYFSNKSNVRDLSTPAKRQSSSTSKKKKPSFSKSEDRSGGTNKSQKKSTSNFSPKNRGNSYKKSHDVNKTTGSPNKKRTRQNGPVKVVLFNKPFDVLTQFTDNDGRKTLKDYIDIPAVYPAGRLDRDSEGLLVLTNDGKLQDKIASPKFKTAKIYWVQVENVPNEEKLQQIRAGLELKDGMTKPAKVKIIEEPENLWPRTPPIRERASIPTCWLQIEITEGKNRQVRRMTAAIGHPTLRLIRYKVGQWTLDDIANGTYREIEL